MEGERIDPSELPASARGRKQVSPEAVAEAVEALKDGVAWKCAETFPNQSQARHAALRMRNKHLMDVDYGNGLTPSTTVWQEDDVWRFLVILR